MNRTTLKAAGKTSEQRLLAQAGTALFGPQYRSEMARQLEVHLRTVMRWDSGETSIPDSAWDRLYGLLIKRHADIGKLIGKLSGGK